MKKLAFSTLLFLTYYALAQKCSDYYYLQNNKTIEITLSNKKGKETGKMIYTISNVTKSGTTTTGTINSEFLDKNGKTASKATSNVKCTGGTLMMDMKMFIPSGQQEQMGTATGTATEAYIEYPANMKEGDMLNDGNISMDFKTQSGIGGHIEVNITHRKVEGKESVTTPAGTWACYKISYHSKLLFKMGIGIPISADVTEWYAPGFGTVKTESGGGKTEITAIK